MMVELNAILRKREPILANNLIYYKISEQEHPECVKIITAQEKTLNQLSWIFGQRHGYKWLRVQSQLGDAREDFYINVHRQNGVQNFTIMESSDQQNEILARYETARSGDQLPLISNNPDDNKRIMTLAEAEDLKKKAGSVDYMQDVAIMNKAPMRSEDLDINLELINRDMTMERISAILDVPFFSDMDVNDLFEKPSALDRNKFYEADDKLRKTNEEIRDSDGMSLGRLLVLIFRIYCQYFWFFDMASLDKQSPGGATEASVYCYTAAQYCLENLQILATAFKMKMIMQDSCLAAIIPEGGSIELTFDMSLKRVPVIYAKDKFPEILSACDEANIMPDFQKQESFQSSDQLESILWDKVWQVRMKSSGNEEVLKDDEKIAMTTEMSNNLGSGKKSSRRSGIFNLKDDFPKVGKSTSAREKSRAPKVRETNLFKFVRVLTTGGENANRDISKCVSFNIHRDDVVTSTMNRGRSATVEDCVPDRSRSNSRPKLAPIQVDRSGRPLLTSEKTPKVQFASETSNSKAKDSAANETTTAQSIFTVTHLAPAGLPRTTLLHACDPNYTDDENDRMGVHEAFDDMHKLSRRSDYLRHNALHDEDHPVTVFTDQIRKKIQESRVHYHQSPEKIRNWTAANIKDFAKGYKELQGFVKSLREESQKIEDTMNRNAKEGNISDLCWKLGKFAVKTADDECSRLLGLITANTEQMNDRNISKSDKEIKIETLKEIVGTFSGEDLTKSVNARTFLQFKDALENNLKHSQVDRQDWGYYAKLLLEGEAKASYEREMSGQSNPDYDKLMGHIQKYHGKVSDILRAVISRQLLLENIHTGTSATKKQEICKDHRACFDKIRRVLDHSSENVGAVRQHLVGVMLKFPEYLIGEIRRKLDDETVDLKKIIDECHKLCDYIHNLASDQIHTVGYDNINQSYTAMAPINPASVKQDTRQARQNSVKPKVFSTQEIDPNSCPICSYVHKMSIRPVASSRTHVVTSNGIVVMDACPNMREMDTTNKALRASSAKLCRRCGKETISAQHTEDSCNFKIKTIQCKNENCELLAAFCERHKHLNTAIHEAKKRRLQGLGLKYNFLNQPILEEEEGLLSQCFLTSHHELAYTHRSVQDMIRSQHPSVLVNNKQGKPIFPIGLMDSLNGGVVPYVFDSGSSLTSILVGTEGIAFPTAPVDHGEQEWSRVIGVGGPTEVRLVYILVPLVSGRMAKIKAQVIENTLRCQTKNLEKLAGVLADKAKAAGFMEPDERIQYPEYGSRSALMLGLSHRHLAPQPIYQADNGLVLYQGCIAGPMTHELSNGNKRTLCIGGSLFDEDCEEKYSNLWLSIPDHDVVKNVIVEGSKARANEWGMQWQDISLTLDEEAMMSLSKDQDRANSIVHGTHRINQSAAELSRNVSALISEADECSLTGGELPNSMVLKERKNLQESQNFLLQHGLEER